MQWSWETQSTMINLISNNKLNDIHFDLNSIRKNGYISQEPKETLTPNHSKICKYLYET